ncbi:hypothetical protein BC831DRAFT_446932 [Entophlyctis helioformis]|nr:hypothetical protein BC831DRAFT_446932 [Entophlyctis helioformis]
MPVLLAGPPTVLAWNIMPCVNRRHSRLCMLRDWTSARSRRLESRRLACGQPPSTNWTSGMRARSPCQSVLIASCQSAAISDAVGLVRWRFRKRVRPPACSKIRMRRLSGSVWKPATTLRPRTAAFAASVGSATATATVACAVVGMAGRAWAGATAVGGVGQSGGLKTTTMPLGLARAGNPSFVAIGSVMTVPQYRLLGEMTDREMASTAHVKASCLASDGASASIDRDGQTGGV